MKTSLARNKHKGAALIEILIASFLFAIGFLSLSSLQTQSFKSSYVAERRAHASMLAVDLTERMRASKPFIETFELGGKRVNVENLIKLLKNKKVRKRHDDVALDSLIRWHNQMINLLPNGRGCVDFLNRRKVVVVEIMWRDTSTTEKGYNCETTPSSSENYYRLMGRL